MTHRGQAMIETVIAVLIVTSIFLCLFNLSRLLTGKILVQHAAMRVARARTVGLNDFICLKAARLAVLPAAGKRIRPAEDDFTVGMERARFQNYMIAPDEGIAAALLDYEGWKTLSVKAGDGRDSKVSFKVDSHAVDGEAGVEQNYQFYLQDQGR